MTTLGVAEQPESYFNRMLSSAVNAPLVRVDRDAYLRSALARRCTTEQISRAIAESPAAAGIPVEILNRVADDSINYETSKVTVISAAAGIPGGFAMIGTVPADSLQYLVHMVRISQKLAYLYSWPDLFGGDGEETDDATKGVLTLFIGVMFGTQAANKGVGILAEMVAKQVLRKLPQQALTKGVIYPIVKNVAIRLGGGMTKNVFASGVAKFIPYVGAVLSGGLTWSTYLVMCKRLKKHLAGLELTVPATVASDPADESDVTAAT